VTHFLNFRAPIISSKQVKLGSRGGRAPIKVVDRYGTGGHVPQIFGLGDTITSVPHYLRSKVKSSQVAISVPFSRKAAVMVKISSFSTDIGCLFDGMSFHHNAYFTLMLTKKLQLLGVFVPDSLPGLRPWTPLGSNSKYSKIRN